jgi:glutamine synthetase
MAEIAADAGLIFTMMADPSADHAGNGLHMHLWLRDNEGRAVMAEASDSHGLSDIGRQCVAGLLAERSLSGRS